MSDLIQQALNVKALASDPSLREWPCLAMMLQSLESLDVERLSFEQSERVCELVLAIEGIFEDFDPEWDEDYSYISKAELRKFLDDNVVEQSTRLIESELDRIIHELDEGVGVLPVEAMQEVRDHRDLMIPRLIDVLKKTTRDAQRGLLPDGNSHFFAFFLLTELQAEEAFPAILEAVSLPGELPFDLFGDAVTSTLARVLALFARDRHDTIDELIRNRSLNEYVRWEAAQTYALFVRDGLLSREEAVRRLQTHLREAIDRDDEAIVNGLICELASLAPEEALEDITEAYRRDLADQSVIGLVDIKDNIAEGDARVCKTLVQCAPTGIENATEELRHWAAFRKTKSERPATSPLPSLPMPHFIEDVERSEPELEPILSGGSRVGRNERCPCGSGKKYKKCCGARK